MMCIYLAALRATRLHSRASCSLDRSAGRCGDCAGNPACSAAAYAQLKAVLADDSELVAAVGVRF